MRSQGGVKHPRADIEDMAVEESADDVDGNAIDAAKVRRPIISLVAPALATAWKVNRKHNMCFLFDAVSPACRFKWGMALDEEADFPKDTYDVDIAETDGPDPGWMPVDPEIIGCAWRHFTPWRQTNQAWHAG